MAVYTGAGRGKASPNQNVMRVSEMSRFMKQCAERIANRSRKYIECSDVETKMDCIDIVTARLNDFTQVFRRYNNFYTKRRGDP